MEATQAEATSVPIRIWRIHEGIRQLSCNCCSRRSIFSSDLLGVNHSQWRSNSTKFVEHCMIKPIPEHAGLVVNSKQIMGKMIYRR